MDKLASHNNISLDDYAKEGIPVEYQIVSSESPWKRSLLTVSSLKSEKCLSMLNFQERQLIEDLFYLAKANARYRRNLGFRR